MRRDRARMTRGGKEGGGISWRERVGGLGSKGVRRASAVWRPEWRSAKVLGRKAKVSK